MPDRCLTLVMPIGARRGGQPGAVAPPLELENDDVICSSLGKYPKIFARARRSHQIPLKLSLKRRKIAKIFVRACGAPKNRSLLSIRAILTPSEKIPAGAHGHAYCWNDHKLAREDVNVWCNVTVTLAFRFTPRYNNKKL